MTEINTSQILLPEGEAHGQLFFILHDESFQATNMPFLLGAIRSEFPDAVIQMSTIELGEDSKWLNPEEGEPDANLASRLGAGIQALEQDIRSSQRTHGVLSEATAVIGVGLAGNLVLGLTLLDEPVASRLITFGARFPAYPLELSLDTTIHLLHADRDLVVPSNRAREAHDHMAQLQADATIDIAMNTGDSFSEILIGKMFERLKTCVPLRYWRYAGEAEKPEGEDKSRESDASLH